MQNAHLRLGLLEYHRMTEKASTRIRLRVDRYVGKINRRISSASSETIPMLVPSRRRFTKGHVHADLPGR